MFKDVREVNGHTMITSSIKYCVKYKYKEMHTISVLRLPLPFVKLHSDCGGESSPSPAAVLA